MSLLFRAVLAAAVVISLAGRAAADIPVVQHVVIVFQENRTPDNLFHGLRALMPTADIADSGVNSKGKTIQLTPVTLAGTYDLGHSHAMFERMYDHGKMDGADRVICGPPPACPANAQFKYVAPSEVAPYFFIATHYGFANRMFQSNQGPSFPAHQYILGATSAPFGTSRFFAADNPHVIDGKAGCTGVPSLRVLLVGPNDGSSEAFPCFERQTLVDLLDHPPAGARSGLSWRYYTGSPGFIWTAPVAIRHLCKPAGNPVRCTGKDWLSDIATPPVKVLSDIASKNLPSVTWVIPSGQSSDHAKGNDGSGPSWVASIVNAIGKSEYWNNTVIFITWDDWGGWYDHVPPPISAVNPYYEAGFRVPLLVVSAYTPKAYVSQTVHTFSSILRFIETAYGLPLIGPGTFEDSRADDLSDFFNFSRKPSAFVPVPAPLKADFFLKDKRPLTDPDDD
jgi:phospholipase C